MPSSVLLCTIFLNAQKKSVRDTIFMSFSFGIVKYLVLGLKDSLLSWV